MDTRLFIDALLWLMRHGGSWKDMPLRFGRIQTIKTRYYRWLENGVFERVFTELLKDGIIPPSHPLPVSLAQGKKGMKMPQSFAISIAAPIAA